MAGLASRYATLVEENWPYEGVDGLTIDCGGFEPRIFIRGDVDHLRTRFTVAHELGHVAIGWHTGDNRCSLDRPFATDPREAEANAFAAELLMPGAWLGQLLTDNKFDLSKTLSNVAAAQASVTASLIAIASVLPVGWAFQVNTADTILSQDYGSISRAQLDATAHRSGTVPLHGQTVRWWRRFEARSLPRDIQNKAQGDELLAQVTSAAGFQYTAHQAHSKVAGLMSGFKQRRLLEIPDLAFSYVHWRLGQSDPALVSEPFELWLGWKISDLAARGGNSPLPTGN